MSLCLGLLILKGQSSYLPRTVAGKTKGGNRHELRSWHPVPTLDGK